MLRATFFRRDMMSKAMIQPILAMALLVSLFASRDDNRYPPLPQVFSLNEMRSRIYV